MQRSVFIGIGLMLLGIFLFAVNDVVGKWLVATYTPWQVLLLRSFAAILVLLPFVIREGRDAILNPPNKPLQVWRVIFGTAEVAAFYWAVVYLPLVDAMTYWLAVPIYIAAISPWLLKERLDWPRWVMVGIGFVGVLIVLRPSAAVLTGPAMIAVAGSCLFAALILSTRMLKGTSSTTLVTWQMVGPLVAGLLLSPIGWVTPTPRDFALLSMLGIVAMVAHVCVAKAVMLAPAAIVSPFQYTLIVWALVLGYFVFGDWPEPAMFIGGGIVIASGLGLIWLENRDGRRKQASA
jgi:drug/metabolite transporter (DMT)-like permease